MIQREQGYTSENVESAVCADKWSTSEHDPRNTRI
jgi:hypothetical protein